MNKEMKELRDQIKAYFGESVSKVKVFRYGKNKCVDVEYEDFYPEARVEKEIRALIPIDYLLGVKREYSDALITEMAQKVICDFHYQDNLNIIRSKPNYFEWMANYDRAM